MMDVSLADRRLSVAPAVACLALAAVIVAADGLIDPALATLLVAVPPAPRPTSRCSGHWLRTPSAACATRCARPRLLPRIDLLSIHETDVVA